MIKTEANKNFGIIDNLLDGIKQRQIPLVSEKATLGHIIDAFADGTHSRLLYVVGDNERLVGVISLGDLIRHVFFHYHEQVSYVDSRNLVKMAVCETAKDFMHKELLCATVSENIEDVLEKMIRHNAKEIPVLDDKKRIVADLTMVDLLKYYKSVKKSDLA
jgi:CBS domain-containing protein